MECLKDKVVNDVMLRMQFCLDGSQLSMLEKSINMVLYNVDVTEMETGLSTHLDDNERLLQIFEMRRKNRISDKSIKQYMLSMKRLLAFCNKNLRDITHHDVEFFMDYLRSNGNNATSVDNNRRNISAVYNWFRKQEVVSINPVDRVEKEKQIKKPIDYLTGMEVEEFRQACNKPREHALFETLLSTMCRMGELLSIKVEDIDFLKGEILILGEKNKEYRTVFLNDKAKLWLKEYIGDRKDGYVFISDRAPYKVLGPSRVNGILKQIGERVTKRRIYAHLFRKTGATIYKEKGCPIEIISKMLGHASVAVTIRWYAAMSTESLRMEHRKYA